MLRIISGGQTGVDRGALDAALDVGTPCGGWCPRGRLAEDGWIPERYPLIEIESDHYSDRTLKNVEDSDGTLIIHFGQLEGGTAFTRRCCIDHSKPHVVMDLSTHKTEDAVSETVRFIAANNIGTLNVAGPRASKVAHARSTTHELIKAVLDIEKGASDL